MNAPPQICVVLPCYNAHQFLPRALDSLRVQTFRDFEIVIVDDGSTDPETISYLDAMPSDIRLIRQENRGLADARNLAFGKTYAAYVVPLDCDDWIAPEFLADAYQAISTAPENSFVFADLTLEGEASGVLQKTYNLFEQLFFNQLPYCMLIPRAVLAEIGGYDVEMRQGYEDWEFNIRLGLNGYEAISLGKPHLHYQVSSSGMLSKKSRPNHIKLWRYIRLKHRNAYTVRGLVQSWRRWRHKKSVRPLIFYLLWEILYRLLPDVMMTGLVWASMPWSHSARTARRQASIAKRAR